MTGRCGAGDAEQGNQVGDDDGCQGDVAPAPEQEERLTPPAADDTLVRNQDEEQGHDRTDAEQRCDQIAVRLVPGGGDVEPARRTGGERQTNTGPDAFRA